MTGRDGFGRIVLAEWTKLRSVPRWNLTLLAAVLLTVLIALLTAAGGSAESASGSGGPSQPRSSPTYVDDGHFRYQPLTGDGSVTARVLTQDDSHEWAKAGVMVRAGVEPGSPYAAMMVTPGHGVRLQSNFTTDIAGPADRAPRWLRLTRTGSSVTGYESADGSADSADWRRVGEVELDGLPATVQVGLFVASANRVDVQRQFGGESVSETSTVGAATFDRVEVTGPNAPWRERDRSVMPGDGSATETDGVVTITGSGDVGKELFREDMTRTRLGAIIAGLMAIIALSVLSITSEYRRGTIRTTFAVSPRRGRVLAAKAVVLGAVTFLAGLVAGGGALLVSGPVMRSNGFATAGLTDGPVLRALVGTAALVAAVAVFCLAVGTILRHSAAAITVVVMLLLVPQIVSTGLPLSAARWLERLTPAAGFAVQQTVERYDTAIGPLAGLGVLCAYAAAAMGVALWLVRRRDA